MGFLEGCFFSVSCLYNVILCREGSYEVLEMIFCFKVDHVMQLVFLENLIKVLVHWVGSSNHIQTNVSVEEA